MSVNGESKFFKIATSIKKMVPTKKITEDYFLSDFDTTSTGSNESEISVQIPTPQTPSSESGSTKATKDSKLKTSKSIRKKFFRLFPFVEEDEEVLNRYSCALLGDILLQGYLYITRNYFGFYSNVFGYVTKILIPILTVEKITKEKTAKIVPNAIGISTSEQKHVFGSFLSRNSTLDFLTTVWQKAISESSIINEGELTEQEINSTESGEGASDKDSFQDKKIHPERLRRKSNTFTKSTFSLKKKSRRSLILFASTTLLILLYVSASIMLYRINQIQNRYSLALEDASTLGSNVAYSDLLQWQTKLRSQSEGAIYSFLDSNLDEIAKVKQSLEALSSLLLDISDSTTEEVSRNPHETAKGVS